MFNRYRKNFNNKQSGTPQFLAVPRNGHGNLSSEQVPSQMGETTLVPLSKRMLKSWLGENDLDLSNISS
jgi:hypothetical protein